MKLPKFIGNKITAYVDEEDYQHQMACHDAGVDPHDIDPANELPLTLNICFPEFLEADGLHTYRTVDWVELQATVWGPVRKKLKLCKIGWHSYSMGVRGPTRSVYQCSDCRKATERVPRWAR